MISAKELRERRLLGLQSLMEEIEAKVVEAAEKGHGSVVFHLQKTQVVIGNDAVNALEDAGYDVLRSRGSDMRGESWDFITIKW